MEASDLVIRTITLVVEDAGEGRLRVQIVPNDGLSAEKQLSALRIAENALIVRLIREAEQRGKDQG